MMHPAALSPGDLSDPGSLIWSPMARARSQVQC